MICGQTKTLEIGLLFLTFLAPLFFGSVHLWAFMSLNVILFLLMLCYPGAIDEYKRLPVLSSIGFLIVFGVILYQVTVSSWNPYATLREMIKWLAYGSGFLLIQRLPFNAVVRWAYAIALLGILESCYGLYELSRETEYVLWQSKDLHEGFATGTFMNRNHFAGLLQLSLGIQLGIWLGAFEKKQVMKLLWVGSGIFVSMLALMKSGSRMGLASFFLALSAFSILILMRRGNKRFLFILMLLGVLMLAFWFGHETLQSRVNDPEELLQIREGRVLVWRDSIRMIQDAPWFGIGLGGFAWAFPKYQSVDIWMGWSHAHQDYLELASELGIPTFTVLMFSFLALWWTSLKKVFSLSQESFPLVWGGLVSITSLGLHSLSDFNLAIPANAMLMVFVFAAVYRLSQNAPEGVT